MQIEQISAEWLEENLDWDIDKGDLKIVPLGKLNGMMGALYLMQLGEQRCVGKFSPVNNLYWDVHFSSFAPFQKEIFFYRYCEARREFVEGFVPKFYWGDYDEFYGGLFIEDLSGCKMRALEEGLSVEEVEMVLDSLARLHAMSAKYTVNCAKPTDDIFSPDDSPLVNIVKEGYLDGVSTLKDKELQDFMRMLSIEEIFRFASQSKLNCIVHGDMWLNNVMFTKERAIIIDFQFATWGNPLNDVAFLFCSSMKDNLRQENTEMLLRYYHQKLLQHSNEFKTMHYHDTFDMFDSKGGIENYRFEDVLSDYEDHAFPHGVIMTIACKGAFCLNTENNILPHWGKTRFQSLSSDFMNKL